MEFEIEKIAELARLSLKSDEKTKLGKDLSSILKYIKKLDSLDTENVEPTSHVLDLKNVFRSDIVNSSNVIEEALLHDPQKEDNFFKVPKIVRND